MKEVEIEVFRAGGKASRMIKPEHLAEVATFDCSAAPVPICFGHPKSDTPAAGTIKGLRADGNRLFATVASLKPEAIEGIKKGDWLNRSFAFFDPTHEANPRPGKWSPRHLGLLGGAAPGIPGMAPLSQALAFSADDEDLLVDGDPADAVIFSGEPDPGTPAHVVFEAKEPEMTGTPTPTPAAAPAPTDADLTARETAFAARVRSQFEASNSRTVDALVAEGKVLPAEADDLKLVFNAFDPEGEELTFGAGDKTSKSTAVGRLSTFLAGALAKRVPVGEGRQSPSGEFTADDVPASGGEVTAKARTLMESDKSLSFEAAVAKVCGE